MSTRSRILGTLVWGALMFVAVVAACAQEAGAEFEWRFSIKANQTAASNVAARNICRKPHRFEIVQQGLPPFMHLRGEPVFMVAPATEGTVPVQFDTTGLAPGLHEGQVIVRCLTCRAEKTCMQDFQRLHIYMTVVADAAQLPQTPSQSSQNKDSQNDSQNKDAIFVPGRILALLASDSVQAAEADARKLAKDLDLDFVQVEQLDSIHAVLATFVLRQGNDVSAKAAALAGKVLLAQPDFVYEAFSPDEEAAIADANSSLQYGPRLIAAQRLHGSVTGQGVKIALIDTGIDVAHPALAGKITDQADMTGKGFTPDVHATLLAGIIAGDPKSGTGVAGIARGANILAIKACQPLTPQAAPAHCWSRTLARGLDLAISKKAAVVNMSLGGPAGVDDPLLKRMVEEAESRNALVVAAAGNGGPKAKPGFPAAISGVIAVTAVDSKEQIFPSATQGDFVDLAAPGVEILTTSPGGGVLISSGTSLATAFVSGTAALALQQQPSLSARELKSLLEHTAQDLGPAGKDPEFGNGLVNACRAVAELRHDGKMCR